MDLNQYVEQAFANSDPNDIMSGARASTQMLHLLVAMLEKNIQQGGSPSEVALYLLSIKNIASVTFDTILFGQIKDQGAALKLLLAGANEAPEPAAEQDAA